MDMEALMKQMQAGGMGGAAGEEGDEKKGDSDSDDDLPPLEVRRCTLQAPLVPR